MNTARQQLLQGVSPEELNDHLNSGDRVVWIHRGKQNEFDVVLETTVDSEVVPEMIVLDFLAHVPVGVLEQRMLDDADLNVGVGQAALNALAAMVKIPGG